MNLIRNINKQSKSNIVTYLIILGLYIVVEVWMRTGLMSSLLQGLLVPLCVYIIMAVSLNLTVGILGELSLGHAGFMCIGAFVAAFFSKINMGELNNIVRFVLALLLAVLVTGIFGFLISVPVLRLQGDYLAIVTLAFGEIIKNVINVLYIGRDKSGFHFSMKDSLSLNLDETGEIIVNGAQGITGTPRDSNYTIGIILVFITLFIVLNFINSRAGRAVKAIRDNSIAAKATGINLTKYKTIAFSISASLAGLAGGLYAHNLATLNATPKAFGYNMSIMILVYVVLGGIGSIRGSVIATIILTLLPELLRGLSDYRMLIYSIILIFMMIINWSPNGKYIKERIVLFIKNLLFKNKMKKENV